MSSQGHDTPQQSGDRAVCTGREGEGVGREPEPLGDLSNK